MLSNFYGCFPLVETQGQREMELLGQNKHTLTQIEKEINKYCCVPVVMTFKRDTSLSLEINKWVSQQMLKSNVETLQALNCSCHPVKSKTSFPQHNSHAT